MPPLLLSLLLSACGPRPVAEPSLVVTQHTPSGPRVARVTLPDGATTPFTSLTAHHGALATCTGGRVLAQQQEGEGVRLVVLDAEGVHPTPLAGLRLRAPVCTAEGAIVVEAAVDGAGDLYRIDADALTRLTDVDGGSFEPDLAADGTLVYASSRDGNPEIHVQATDGSPARRLTHHPAEDLRPRWSPDGHALVFLTEREGPLRAWTMAADGSGARPVLPDATGEHLDAGWTPRGDVVLVVADAQGQDVVIADPSRRRPARRLGGPDPDDDPQVSPDGRWLARTRRGDTTVDVVLLELASGREVVVPGAWGARWLR
ncbi:MAG: PD40 domain-containing protein [Alphaproteobacteria bacterium]|nr:PD40 domain-containing protein [Alphaproteobacteria bacterium]